MYNESNLIVKKTIEFSVRIVNLYKFLKETKDENVMSKQLLRCATSIGANVNEAIYGQSKLDFMSKFSISLKETSETNYWLLLLYRTGYLSETQYISLKTDCDEIFKIITAIVKTSKQK